MRSIADAIDEAGQTARGIMLCGGEKFFSNGVDLEWALSLSRAEIRAMFLELGASILKLLESPLPIVGVAKGHAIGGALAIAIQRFQNVPRAENPHFSAASPHFHRTLGDQYNVSPDRRAKIGGVARRTQMKTDRRPRYSWRLT